MSSWVGLLLLCAFATFSAGFLPVEAFGHGLLDSSPEKQPGSTNGCDIFHGSWIKDDTYPLYESSSCPYIGQGFDCQRNGRPDTGYLEYKWKPFNCDLPRFDARDFLARNRGKKILFVGDSLSNNMWRSLLCMIHAVVPNGTLSYPGGLSTYQVPTYGVSISLLKNPFLVDLTSEKVGRVLKLDRITTGGQWKGMDVLIFNSYHWWNHRGRLQPWDYIQLGNKTVKDMDRMKAYKMAMTTWGKWVDSNIDPKKTQAFYQGIAPVHLNARDWGGTAGATCKGETEPVKGSTYPDPREQGEAIISAVISKMKNPARLLDITQLTQLRKDGHPSTYAGTQYSDCSHWCVAGVPDTWNEILYAMLLET